MKTGELADLITSSVSELLEHLSRAIPGNSESQIQAWKSEIEVLQREGSEFLREVAPAYGVPYLLEYELPKEAGRRPDVLLLLPGRILVLEFKEYGMVRRSDLDQVAAYARDLAGYHSACANLTVDPVLVLCGSGAKRQSFDGVGVVPAGMLAGYLSEKSASVEGEVPDLAEFIDGEYGPLPTLVHAARMLFQEEALPFVKRAHSAGVHDAVENILEDARHAREKNLRRLVLVTGVPGAGKTLVGLQVAHSAAMEEGYRFGKRKARGAPATFLSGNAPLVKVLQNALQSTAFVQDMHRFIREYGLEKPDRVPYERLIVFDEAQRAWDEKKVTDFYTKKLPNIDSSVLASEPQILTRVADRLEDGAVVLALVGQGQEIHTGEESGMPQWAHAIEQSSHQWSVLGPPELQGLFESSGIDYSVDSTLNLDTGLRYHAAEDLHHWVEALLDHGDLSAANVLATKLREAAFPIYVTRNLSGAQRYVTDRFSGEAMRRYGQLASSKSYPFLTNYGLDTGFQATKRIRVGEWFNAEPEEARSCCQLQDTITEFQCQGLEVDFSIICWANDFTWSGDSWQILSKRKSSLIQNPHQLRTNAYRVLLTRGREGMILFVPEDHSLDSTYQALVAAGAQPVQG